jgi:hypothetical protein
MTKPLPSYFAGLRGVPTAAPPPYANGFAGELNGIDQYFLINNNSIFDFDANSQSFSWFMLIRPSLNPSTNAMYFGATFNTGAGARGIGFTAQSGHMVFYVIQSYGSQHVGGKINAAFSTISALNTWTGIGGTWDHTAGKGLGSMKIFVEGIGLQAAASHDVSGSINGSTVSGASLNIGRHPSLGFYFPGLKDRLMFFSGVKTQAQFESMCLGNADVPALATSLSSTEYFDFENTPNGAMGSTGSGINSPTYSSSVRV